MTETQEQFFDRISGDYTAAIERCVPRYREMLWALRFYLPETLRGGRIIELGCGSGNWTECLVQSFSDARVEAVDLSAELLEQARSRLQTHAGLSFRREDIRSMEVEPGSVQVVTSTIAIHHLTNPEKASLFKAVHQWLAPGGVFAYSDQFRGATEAIHQRHMNEWHRLAQEREVPDSEWDEWMSHQDDHDYHATLNDQLKMLQDAGFGTTDCVWRHLLWTVLVAEK